MAGQSKVYNVDDFKSGYLFAWYIEHSN
jgi:hypothetical protein